MSFPAPEEAVANRIPRERTRIFEKICFGYPGVANKFFDGLDSCYLALRRCKNEPTETMFSEEGVDDDFIYKAIYPSDTQYYKDLVCFCSLTPGHRPEDYVRQLELLSHKFAQNIIKAFVSQAEARAHAKAKAHAEGRDKNGDDSYCDMTSSQISEAKDYATTLINTHYRIVHAAESRANNSLPVHSTYQIGTQHTRQGYQRPGIECKDILYSHNRRGIPESPRVSAKL